jgi:arylsulfatase A-like enzyme
MASAVLTIILIAPLCALLVPNLSHRGAQRVGWFSLTAMIAWLLFQARSTASFQPLMVLSAVALLAVAGAVLAMRRLPLALFRYGLPLYAFAAMAIVYNREWFVLPMRGWLLVLLAAMCANMVYYARRPGTIGPQTTLMLSLWFALATTLLENGWRATRWLLFDPMLSVNCDSFMISMRPEVHWMVPAAHLIAFFAVGSLLAFISWRRPSALTPRVVVFCLAFLTSLTVFCYLLYFLNPPIQVAMALLPAWKIASELDQRFEWFLSVVRRSLPWTSSLVVGLALITFAAGRVEDYRRITQIPAPKSDLPNVLLITLDTVRPQNLSLCGYHRRTSPRLEELAGRGVLFDRAIATASWTLPSHASLMTGKWPHEHRADYTRMLDGTFPTLAEVLGKQGYVTAGFVANDGMCGSHTGLARGFVHYEDHKDAWSLIRCLAPLYYLIPLPDNADRKSAKEVNDGFIHWLEQRPSRPFFVFLNYLDAHAPYFLPDSRFDRFSDLAVDVRRHYRTRWSHGFRGDDTLECKLAQDTYDGAIAYLDHHIGLLMDELARRRLLDNTLVVITNDHGEHFGEHGALDHGTTLYRQEIESPLLFVGPGVSARNVRVHAPVSLVDVPATIIDLLGLAGETPISGLSLTTYWQPDKLGAPRRLRLYSQVTVAGENLEKNKIVSVIADGMHYIRHQKPVREELYDFDLDPLEVKDLAGSQDRQPSLPDFRRDFAWVDSHGPARSARLGPLAPLLLTRTRCGHSRFAPHSAGSRPPAASLE